MAGRPLSRASIDFQLRIPSYRLLQSVPVKPIREKLKCGAERPGTLFTGHPLGTLVSGLCTLAPHVRCIPEMTLSLVEF
jgi:hypothetical protein